MMNSVGFQNFSAGFMTAQFGNIAQMASSPMINNMGVESLYNMSNQFAQFGLVGGMGQIQTQRVSGFAAIPDFANSGQLEVDKKAGVVHTPGGFQIKVKDGEVKIMNPETKKWTSIKAEPPGRTTTEIKNGKQTRTTSKLERVLPRDPAVREEDGDVWRYQGLGTFRLPDGTSIRINEVGKGKDLHIDQIDIYNGNKHVGIKSKLTSSKYKTVKTDSKTEFGSWQNTGSRTRRSGRSIFRDTTQQRTTKTTLTHHQVADQKFETTFSDVKNDGYIHDAMNADGEIFTLAGEGKAWSQFGREVVSGAGKGKDDKTKKYQLGDRIANSNVGARQLHVPWKGMMFDYMQQAQSQLNGFMGGFMANNSNQFLNFGQPQGHLGTMAQLPTWGVNSVYAGPFGGAGMSGGFFNQSMGAQPMVQNMFNNVSNMNSFFMGQISMGSNLSSAMFGSFRV